MRTRRELGEKYEAQRLCLGGRGNGHWSGRISLQQFSSLEHHDDRGRDKHDFQDGRSYDHNVARYDNDDHKRQREPAIADTATGE